MMPQHIGVLIWLRNSIFFALCAIFHSAMPAQPPKDPGQPNADLPEKTQPDKNPIEREHTIYIPYSKLRDVFEKEGRGVFLPYEKFQELWNAAREHRIDAPTPRPPVDSIINEAENEATVEKDVVRVRARLSVELLKQGWNKVPLRLNEAAIQSATVGGETARILPAPGGGYTLLIENKGQAAQSIELKLEYARAFTKSPGQNSVSFDAPQAPVNRWRIRIPQAGAKVNVQPLIAATESPENPATPGDNVNASTPAADPTKETVILAFVGAAQQVRIDWTPKSDGATGLTALATVQAQQEVFIDEGAVRTRVNLQYQISRAQLTQLQIDVPVDQKVVSVFDANVRKWEIEKQDSLQRIKIELFDPASSAQNITLELEKFYDGEIRDFQTPVVTAVDIGRQQGTVLINVNSALRAEVTQRTGLLQMDAGELPAAVASGSWSFAYRYAALPFDLKLNLEKVQPRVSVDQLVEAYLEPDQISLDLVATYNIEQAGLFQFEIKIPEGYEVRQVRGHSPNGATPASVDAHSIAPSDKTRLLVGLSRKAIGKVGLLVQLQKRLTDVNLLSPTGLASTLTIPVLQVNQTPLERATGRLVIFAPESLRVNPTAPTGLRAIPFSEAYTTTQSVREGRFPNSRPVLAYAFAEPLASLDLSAERRKPYVTSRQRLVAHVDSGVVRYETSIFFEILYSGVKSLRIDVPTDIAADIRNSSPLREAPLDPQPNDVSNGYTAWSLTGQSELLGRHAVSLSWERKISELDVGKSADIAVPHIRPAAVDRSWGQIVLSKSESLDVEPKGTPIGLRQIDPQHDVMPDAAVPNAARAFEYQDDWSLNLTATRYKIEEVKHTSIERALLRMVVTRSDRLGVQALYRVRSSRQRLTMKLPTDAEFDAQPLRINGSPISLERGEQDERFVPLVGQDANKPFVLELRYTVPGGLRNLNIPEFPENPAVQKVYLSVFLPDELTLLDVDGPWTEEWTWQSTGRLGKTPQLKQTDDQLAQWVTEGIQLAASPPFQKDGTQYVFSALKPKGTADGALKLIAIRDKWLAGAVFGVLALVGLLMLLRPLHEKLIALAMLLIGAVICGVFSPTLAQQLLNFPTYAATSAVLIAWAAISGSRGLQNLTKAMQPSPSSVPVTAEKASNDVAASQSGETAQPSPASNDSSAAEGGANHG